MTSRDLFLEDSLKKDDFKNFRRTVSKEDLNKKGCIIYGAGLLGKLVSSNIGMKGVTPLCFIDAHPERYAYACGNIPIYSPEKLKDYAECYVILCSSYGRSIIDENPILRKMNLLFWGGLRDIYPVLPALPEDIGVFFDNPLVNKIYGLLEDDISKKIYKNFINFHINFDATLFSFYDPNIYFPDGIELDCSRFIDAGAADGDTLKSWLERGYPKAISDYYFAFEPNNYEYMELQKFFKTLPTRIREHISVNQVGLGESNSLLYLHESGKSSQIYRSYTELNGAASIIGVRVVRLDDFPLPSPPTLIKMDVEGEEIPLLSGAVKTIRQWKPGLAISVYHKYSDIWEIPLWIHALDPKYKIYLRHHLRSYGDTVCYAVYKNS